MTNEGLREVERDSIRRFVEANSRLLTGRVVDFGCGRSPYRYAVEDAGGVYVGFDRAAFPANVSGRDLGPDDWGDVDAVLMTQVLQYLPDPGDVLYALCEVLCGGDPAVLVMTGPTTWPVVEPEDLWRFTPAGVRVLLEQAGFSAVEVGERWSTWVGQVPLLIGWQAVAYA